MRERLIATLVGLTIAVISLYGVPRAYFLADLVRDNTQSQLDDAATLVSVSIRERAAAGGEVDAALLRSALSSADSVTYTPADGDPVVVGRPETDSDQSVTVTRDLADGSRLTLTASASRVQDEIWRAILPLVLLGLALAALAAVVGFVMARRLSRPFRELAGSARMLGYGRFDAEVPRYAVPEADAIATSLRQTAARLDQLVRREREFAANASHQLRTPITALRLQLEDLTLWPDTSPTLREELELGLAELDRLSTSIDDLLGLARGQQLGHQIDVDLAALVNETSERWRTILGESARGPFSVGADVVPARVAPGPVSQVLDVLIDNAFTHGSGRITVATRDVGTHLEVRVADEGDSQLTFDVFRRGVTTRDDAEGHGVGLAVASELAELAGGHLSIDHAAATSTFVLWLPRPV
ncbi:HAMP domain-containing histidine kinase [Nocardioides sp. JQ2195]|uniref:ATP-binding protein n=1 Tax=Nocardioides sp. JQ2195 TaxID=2592334 RepID=UPI00143E71DF|nr:histidine kinase dimerization/phospho-acceptor domain-containing protein [Nocardioides sp. JQ2195]QIX28446.1 HAMP domain-containing histidine kinase [Nocardioides sp. JQ2195]